MTTYLSLRNRRAGDFARASTNIQEALLVKSSKKLKRQTNARIGRNYKFYYSSLRLSVDYQFYKIYKFNDFSLPRFANFAKLFSSFGMQIISPVIIIIVIIIIMFISYIAQSNML